uniref:HAT C-terminal dimerisation domain-containing protein n=1 Tax=Amphimedon queenslandica TaxID=400682 RepID=A0A1X7TZY3_AMPQE
MVEQWLALRSYFASTDERLVIVQRTLKRLDNPILKLYFLFLDEILPLFSRFNQLFLSERPLLHVLHSELIVLYKKYLLKFVKEEVVDAHAHNILELDVANEDHHLSNDQLFVGVATRRFIDSCDEIDEIRKRCPLDDPLLKLLSFLDPHQCKQVQLSNILQVAKRFPNVIKEEDIESLKDEIDDFKLQTFDDGLLQKDPYVFWSSISKLEDPVSGDLRHSQLSNLAKALLILPHGNADTERFWFRNPFCSVQQPYYTDM